MRPFRSAAYKEEGPLLDGVLESERGLTIDLHLFGDQSPVVMCESASSLQAQHLFRCAEEGGRDSLHLRGKSNFCVLVDVCE